MRGALGARGRLPERVRVPLQPPPLPQPRDGVLSGARMRRGPRPRALPGPHCQRATSGRAVHAAARPRAPAEPGPPSGAPPMENSEPRLLRLNGYPSPRLRRRSSRRPHRLSSVPSRFLPLVPPLQTPRVATASPPHVSTVAVVFIDTQATRPPRSRTLPAISVRDAMTAPNAFTLVAARGFARASGLGTEAHVSGLLRRGRLPRRHA